MGNTNVKGADEVPVSDLHPWGVNGNIKMPIPLGFANQMRKDGTELNSAYKNFIAHKTYEIIPSFINLSTEFPELYPGFVQATLGILGQKVPVIVEPAVKTVKISSFPLNLLLQTIDQQNVAETRGLPLDDILLTKMWVINDKFSLILYKYPNYVNDVADNIVNEVHTSIDPVKYMEDITFSNSPYLFNIVDVKGDKKKRKLKRLMLDPLKFKSWDAYIEMRKYKSALNKNRPRNDPIYFADDNLKVRTPNEAVDFWNIETLKGNEILERCNTRQNAITLLPVDWVSDYGAHATTVIIDHINRIIYLTDSNGVNSEAKYMEYFLKKNNRFQNYTVMPIMPQENGPGFQGISEDSFCQTWTLFIGMLVILNHLNGDSKDLNTVVFNEIIKYAKPLVGYEENMSPGVKLGLIVIEYMFYLYNYMEGGIKTYYSPIIQGVKNAVANDIRDDEDMDFYIYNQITVNEEEDPYEWEQQYQELKKEYKRTRKQAEMDKISRIYKYSDNVKLIINKLTEHIDVKKYNSYQLVKAIISGKLKIV